MAQAASKGTTRLLDVGPVRLGVSVNGARQLCAIRLNPDWKKSALRACRAGALETSLLDRVQAALETYFAGLGASLRRNRHAGPLRFVSDPFEGLPLESAATPFQRRVREALQGLPPGSVISYGALARHLNTCSQAIGQACARNPLPIVVPCHRVVGADGLGGYTGGTDGLEIKRWLLERERAPLRWLNGTDGRY